MRRRASRSTSSSATRSPATRSGRSSPGSPRALQYPSYLFFTYFDILLHVSTYFLILCNSGEAAHALRLVRRVDQGPSRRGPRRQARHLQQLSTFCYYIVSFSSNVYILSQNQFQWSEFGQQVTKLKNEKDFLAEENDAALPFSELELAKRQVEREVPLFRFYLLFFLINI